MSSQAGDEAELERDFETLGLMNAARFEFEKRICVASISRDEQVLDVLRIDKMFEFAEFFFTLHATRFDGPEDIAILAEMHNDRLEKLLGDERAMKRRGLRKDRLLDAIFTSDTRPRLEHIWRETPGALDQSNLARFLVAQMSLETTRSLIVASEKAGFMTRRKHITGAIVCVSTGVMERVLGECLREMRHGFARLQE